MGPPSSQSTRCLPFLQSWWKHLEFQHFHLLAEGFNIQAPSLNNKHETVSSSDANVIKYDAALTAILLHHADIFPKAGGVIQPVPLRNSSTAWWGGGQRISVFHHRPIHHNVTHVPTRHDSSCAFPGVGRVRIFSVINQDLITSIHDPRLGPGIRVCSMSSESTILKKKKIILSPLLHQDLFPLQSRGRISLSKALTHLQRNHINVRKVVWIQFSFISFTFHKKSPDCFHWWWLDLGEVIAGQLLLNTSFLLRFTLCLMPIWLCSKHIIFKVRWGRHCLMPFITKVQLG